MSTVTKEELALALLIVANSIDNGSTKNIRDESFRLETEQPSPLHPKINSLWVGRLNGFVYKAIGIHDINRVDGKSVLLQRHSRDPAKFRDVPNLYQALSDFHNRFTKYQGEPKPVVPADTPAWYSKWSNNKSGDIYKVIGLSNLNSTREDFPPTVIYERESDNTTWSRTLVSFMLKFKPV